MEKNRLTKKIMILGVGNAQVDLIDYCKQNNFEVHTCSYKREGSGLQSSDIFNLIDVKNAVKIEQYLIENSIPIVYSIGSDIAIPTIAEVTSKLGLPSFVSHDTAINCKNKDLLRIKLRKNKTSEVPYTSGKSIEDFMGWNIYPAIMKPTDSQGQRGVTRIDSKDELTNKFETVKSYSDSGNVIVEKFIQGDEISVNAYVVNGQVMLSIISDRIIFEEYTGGLVKEHVIPSKFSQNDNVIKKVEELVKSTISELEINNGPAYFQIKVENNIPYLIEVTPRLDGCHMWKLIERSTKVNLLDITLNHLINDNVNQRDFEYHHVVPHRLIFKCSPPGVPLNRTNIEGENVKWYLDEGQTVPKLNGIMEKTGYYIIKE